MQQPLYNQGLVTLRRPNSVTLLSSLFLDAADQPYWQGGQRASWWIPRSDWLSHTWNWLLVQYHSTVRKHRLTSKHSPDGPDSLTRGSITTGSKHSRLTLLTALPRALSYQSERPLGWPCCLLAWLQKLVCSTQPVMYQCSQLFSHSRREWRQTVPGDITAWLVSLQLRCWHTLENQQLSFQRIVG